MKIHIVRHGDTPDSIASHFGCSVDALIETNMLPFGCSLVPGLALCAPSESARRIEVLGFQNCNTSCLTYFSACRASVAPSGALSFSEDACGFRTADVDAMPLLGINFEDSHGLLHDSAAQDALLAQLFPVLALRGFRAVLLENTPVYSFDADAFRSFLTLLSAALHSIGCFLFTTIGTESIIGLFDGADSAAVHGEFADRIILDTGTSMLSEKEALIEKISSDIDIRKLLLGLDVQAVKLCGDEHEVVSSRNAVQLALSAAEKVYYDTHRAVALFGCVDASGKYQRIYFTDPRGLDAVTSLADRFSLAGIAPHGVPIGLNALNIEKFIS